MKKIPLILIAAVFLLLISGCNNQKSTASNNDNVKSADSNKDKQVTLKFGYASNSQPVIDAMNKFGDLVSEKTDGEVKVEYYPDGQLGGERELIELTQAGAIDVTKVSGSTLEGFSDIYSIFSVPYLFEDEDHYYKTLENKQVMNPIYKSTEDQGIIGLTYYTSGARNFYMTDGPVEKPDDLKGKNIRVMNSESQMKMVQALGGSPTPIGSDGVYSSLQQGIIDGSENNEFALATAGHGEITKFYSYDEHTRIPDMVMINKETLDKLSDKHTKAIYEAADESKDFQKKIWEKYLDKEKKEATDKYNVKFNEVDKEPFRKAVQPIHDEFKNDKQFGNLYKKIQSLSKE